VPAIKTGEYKRAAVCVAYATRSGTSRICAQLAELIKGGGSARVAVGIDNGVTSLEAVEQLLSVGTEVWGCEVPSVLFHPKVYALAGPKKAWVSIGSSNLTARGLFRNVESNVLFELDLEAKDDQHFLKAWEAWMQNVIDTCGRKIAYDAASLQAYLDREALVREADANKNEVATPSAKAGIQKPKPKKPISFPALPAPMPPVKSLLPAQSSSTLEANSKPSPIVIGAPNYFAMTLSAFDCSHKTGTPGTPEVSIPEAASAFFPAVKKTIHKYPDAYFNVRLNFSTGKTDLVTYRLWQRPAGSAVGHADWRINVQHATMDLSSTGGGDILLFERLEHEGVNYDVWVIKPGEDRYKEILDRCTDQVVASGAAGVKRYGLF